MFFFLSFRVLACCGCPVELCFKVMFSSPTFSSRTSTACFTRRIKSERVCPLIFGLTFILCMRNLLLLLILYSLGLHCVLPQTNSRLSRTNLICALASIFKVISTSVQPASFNRNCVGCTLSLLHMHKPATLAVKVVKILLHNECSFLCSKFFYCMLK